LDQQERALAIKERDLQLRELALRMQFSTEVSTILVHFNLLIFLEFVTSRNQLLSGAQRIFSGGEK
jgi:hypothetical protein